MMDRLGWKRLNVLPKSTAGPVPIRGPTVEDDEEEADAAEADSEESDLDEPDPGMDELDLGEED